MKKTIRVVTDIAAAVSTVWAELSAVQQYAEWNPFITTFHGQLVVGNRPEICIVPPGAPYDHSSLDHRGRRG